MRTKSSASNDTLSERAVAMPSRFLKSFSQPESTTDLLSRATSLLNSEVIRLQPVRPGARGAALEPGGLVSHVPGAGAERTALEQPTSEMSALVPRPLDRSSAGAPMDLLTSLLSGANADELRRRASDFLETLLASVTQGNAAPTSAYDDRVPLVRSVAPVRAGTTGSVTLQVSNEEASTSEVSLYASNFVADSGYEMPSLSISITPRRATLQAAGQALFEIKLSVPTQAPPGLYSGLVQAAGCKYVKAVVVFEVL